MASKMDSKWIELIYDKLMDNTNNEQFHPNMVDEAWVNYSDNTIVLIADDKQYELSLKEI